MEDFTTIQIKKKFLRKLKYKALKEEISAKKALERILEKELKDVEV